MSADAGLTLSPNHGAVGSPVRAEQTVGKCAVFVVRFDGEIVGTEDGSDGQGTVDFLVLDRPLGAQRVVAGCQAAAGGDERVVGAVEFTVTPVTSTSSTSSTSSTVTTTLVPTTNCHADDVGRDDDATLPSHARAGVIHVDQGDPHHHVVGYHPRPGHDGPLRHPRRPLRPARRPPAQHPRRWPTASARPVGPTVASSTSRAGA